MSQHTNLVIAPNSCVLARSTIRVSASSWSEDNSCRLSLGASDDHTFSISLNPPLTTSSRPGWSHNVVTFQSQKMGKTGLVFFNDNKPVPVTNSLFPALHISSNTLAISSLPLCSGDFLVIWVWKPPSTTMTLLNSSVFAHCSIFALFYKPSSIVTTVYFPFLSLVIALHLRMTVHRVSNSFAGAFTIGSGPTIVTWC